MGPNNKGLGYALPALILIGAKLPKSEMLSTFLTQHLPQLAPSHYRQFAHDEAYFEEFHVNTIRLLGSCRPRPCCFDLSRMEGQQSWPR